MKTRRHLDYPDDRRPEDIGPAGLDDVLDRGDLDEWAPLAAAIEKDPFAPLADTVLRLCAVHDMYGTSALWTTWIERLRARPERRSLRELRKGLGLTQTEVAERMGSSQSDVSKLERRDDVRVSTLREYVRALGGELDLLAQIDAVRAVLRLRESLRDR